MTENSNYMSNTCTHYWQSSSSLLIIKLRDALWHLSNPWTGVTKLLCYGRKKAIIAQQQQWMPSPLSWSAYLWDEHRQRTKTTLLILMTQMLNVITKQTKIVKCEVCLDYPILKLKTHPIFGISSRVDVCFIIQYLIYCTGFIPPNESTIMNDSMMIWKETVMTKFNVSLLSKHLLGTND